MIKTFVVLSTPSSASSLIAECLSQKIFMTNDGSDGHFENPIMLKLSMDILAYAREIDTEPPLIPGHAPRRKEDPWDDPPSEKAILACADKFATRIQKDVQEQSALARLNEPIKNPMGYAGRPARCWGWKDGRIGLIIPIVAPYLENPHYLFLHRDVEETAQAITRRHEIAGHPIPIEHSRVLVREYHKRIIKFLS